MKFEVIIIGAGCLGLFLACALAKAGFVSCVIERQTLPKNIATPSKLFAFSQGSLNIINKALALNLLDLGQSINHIRIAEYNSTFCLDFAPQEVGLENFGLMIEEKEFYNKLQSVANELENLTLIDECNVQELEQDESKIIVKTNKGVFLGKMGVIADGKNSTSRDLLGIEVYTKDYHEEGIIADIKHTNPHDGVALEYFTQQGAFAILPKKGGYESSIVFALKRGLKEALFQLPEAERVKIIKEKFPSSLGEITLGSELKAFPLFLQKARNYTKGRYYLLGDVLHNIHPVAGQGLNLSLRDAYFLFQSIIKADSLGLDIGVILDDYQRVRFLDNQILITATDFFDYIFCNSNQIIKMSRQLGMQVLQDLSFLKKAIIKYAVGQSIV